MYLLKKKKKYRKSKYISVLRIAVLESLLYHYYHTLSFHIVYTSGEIKSFLLLSLSLLLLLLLLCVVYRGIPGVSKDREARMEAIVQQLVTGNEEYDFVFLQEVWSKADYHLISSKVSVYVCVCVRVYVCMCVYVALLHSLFTFS